MGKSGMQCGTCGGAQLIRDAEGLDVCPDCQGEGFLMVEIPDEQYVPQAG